VALVHQSEKGKTKMTELLDVPAAAKGLDQLYPGWQNMVDIDRLDMFSCSRCVLGQIGLSIHGGCYMPHMWVSMYGDFVQRIGRIEDGVFADNWYAEAWVAEIKARRFNWQEQIESAPQEELAHA
jgi:hypothetical protein